jgi:SAM-dependent methyltransferase
MARDNRQAGNASAIRRCPAMSNRAIDLWNAKALEWATHIGENGDANRRHNSDPVLFDMLGDVADEDVVDAGCGTGYLAVLLTRRRARVVAVDAAEAMVARTRERGQRECAQIDVRLDSASELATLGDETADAIVSNYVLMDLPDLNGAARSFARVLRASGRAVVVINHPCFMVRPESLPTGSVRYTWEQSYFEERDFEERWGSFTTPFVTYHRPLRSYFAAFHEAGLAVDRFDEPALSAERPADLSEERAHKFRMCPYSVAFRLTRRTG